LSVKAITSASLLMSCDTGNHLFIFGTLLPLPRSKRGRSWERPPVARFFNFGELPRHWLLLQLRTLVKRYFFWGGGGDGCSTILFFSALWPGRGGRAWGDGDSGRTRTKDTRHEVIPVASAFLIALSGTIAGENARS
jgi:hypothetical protein